MLKRWRDLDRKAGLPLLRLAVEQGVLGPVPGAHWLARKLLTKRLQVIEPLFDRDFYLRQVHAGWSWRAAERDAALHYHLVGRFHQCSPHPDFDPIAYRDAHPHLTWVDDPIIDFGRRPERVVQAAPRRNSSYTGSKTVVTLHHVRGGGSSHYLDLLEQRLRGEGFGVVRLVRLSPTAPLFRPLHFDTKQPLGPVFDLVKEPGCLGGLLGAIRADRLVVNHAVDLPPEALPLIAESCRKTGVPFEAHLHDYFYLCPRINLIDAGGRYCGAPRDRVCSGCVFRYPGRPPWSRAAWRDTTLQFLSAAESVIGPSLDVANRYKQIWPDLDIVVRFPEEDAGLCPPRRQPRGPGQLLTVAVLGRLNVPKGFDVVLALASHIRRRKAPVRLVLIGQSIDDAALRKRGVLVHGRYRDDEAFSLLGRYAPHLVFIPSIWPETWSFVLSISLRAQLPVAAFDLGAIGERLRRFGYGTLLPLELADRPDQLLAELIAAAGLGSASDVSESARSLACD